MLLLENTSTSFSSRLDSSTMDNLWHVKITGIHPGTRIKALANILNLPVQNILIPLQQQHGPVWFAWLNNFQSEQEAMEFATHWSDKRMHPTSNNNIRCTVRPPGTMADKKTLFKNSLKLSTLSQSSGRSKYLSVFAYCMSQIFQITTRYKMSLLNKNVT
jgi:hypothetical protein